MQHDPSFTHEQRASLNDRVADQDQTLAAMHFLQSALGEAGPRRETQWLERVRHGLQLLSDATNKEFHNASQPDSLLADIKRTQPRLRTQAKGIRLQYQAIRDSITALEEGLRSHTPEAIDVADLRLRISQILLRLHHERARESDLIYDAYYDAFNADLLDTPDR